MNNPADGGSGVPYGPWGFDSRMGVEEVDRADAESLGPLEPRTKVEPVEQDFNDHLKASITNLDLDPKDLLKSRFAGQIEGGTAWWSGDRAEGG